VENKEFENKIPEIPNRFEVIFIKYYQT